MESVGFFVAGQAFPHGPYGSVYPSYPHNEDMSPQTSPAAHSSHPGAFYPEYSPFYTHPNGQEAGLYAGPSTPQELSTYFFNSPLSVPTTSLATTIAPYQHDPSSSSVTTPPLTPKTPPTIGNEESSPSYPGFEEEETREFATSADGVVRVVVKRKQTNKKERR